MLPQNLLVLVGTSAISFEDLVHAHGAIPLEANDKTNPPAARTESAEDFNLGTRHTAALQSKCYSCGGALLLPTFCVFDAFCRRQIK